MTTGEEDNFIFYQGRVAGLGRLSAGANMAMKPFVKRVFTIFATNASFLCVIADLVQHFFPKKKCF